VLWHGTPLRGLFWLSVEAVPDGSRNLVVWVNRAAVFANWPALKAAVLRFAEGKGEVQLNLSRTRLVDHSVMDKLHELQREMEEGGKRLVLLGLEKHVPLSPHPHAARRLDRDTDRVPITLPEVKLERWKQETPPEGTGVATRNEFQE
jgi:MFS superfamily sulfate permease-like transporter